MVFTSFNVALSSADVESPLSRSIATCLAVLKSSVTVPGCEKAVKLSSRKLTNIPNCFTIE